MGPGAQTRRSGARAGLGASPREVDQARQDALAVGAQAVVAVLARDPGAQAADVRGGLLGEDALDVRVLGVDGRGGRDVVAGELLGVVEPGPLALGEEVRRLAQRPQRAVVLEHPREDVLAEEQRPVLAPGVRHRALGRPARRDAVGPARLVDERVERVAGEAEGALDVVRERGRVGVELEHVVEELGADAHAEAVPELAQTAGGEPIAGGQLDRLGLEAVDECADALPVLRVALVVAGGAGGHGGPRDAREAGPRPAERGGAPRGEGPAPGLRAGRGGRRHPQAAAGDERLAQAFGRDREVRRHAQAAEALAEDAPPLDTERAAQQLGVADDGVGAEVREVLGLLGGRAARERRWADGRRAPGAALVEHEDAELAERAVEPAGAARVARRPRRLRAGPALEEDEEGPVAAVGVGHLAREDGDLRAVGGGVVERYLELVLDEDEPAGADRRRPGHRRRRPLPLRRPSVSSSSSECPAPTATHVRGESARNARMCVSAATRSAKPRSSEPPPASRIPWRTMSPASSGGVSSSVAWTAAMMSVSGEAIALRTSSLPRLSLRGRPESRSRPRMSTSSSVSSGAAEPTASLIASALCEPIAMTYSLRMCVAIASSRS